MDPLFLEALTTGILLLAGAAVAITVWSRRGLSQGPRMPPALAWQAAEPSLAALGMRKLDAECYTLHVASGGTLYLKLHVRDAELRAWLDCTCRGGVLETFPGAKTELRPGQDGRSGLAAFLSGAVGPLLSALPRGARLSVEAPEIPGATYKTSLTTPFNAPDHAALVTRVLVAFDEAARRPASPEAQVQLPPVARIWQAAQPSLEALGMRTLDAETYRISLASGGTLYLSLHLRDAGARAWLEHPCAGGVLETFLGGTTELSPGEHGRSGLAQFVSSAVGNVMSALPRGARLSVSAPEIPRADYKASLTTPLSAPEHPAAAVRTLLALDDAARRPASPEAHVQIPPVARIWQAAVPSLQALGMHALDAETCTFRLASGGTLYVKLDVRDASLRAWQDSRCAGGPLEGMLGAEAEIGPGDSGRSEAERFVAATVRAVLGQLPRTARLSVKAPEIRGDSYKANLTTPFSSPEQAAIVARVLHTLDEAVRGQTQ